MTMFDKITVAPTRTETHYVDRNIIINRAPTDESVKLLKEFERAAEDKVFEKFSIRSNELDAIAFFTMDSFSGEKHALIKFKLNGKEYKTELGIDHKDMFMESKEGRVKLVFKQLSEWLAAEILKSQAKEVIQWLK